MTGWISLHRSIENHWLFKDKRVFSKFEAWIYLLLEANHKDNKITIGNQLVEVKRGQKLTSILTLSKLWNWSRTKTNSFFELLKKDNMIDIKKTSKYTLITIVNYDFYQSEASKKKHQIEQQSEHQKDIKKTSIEHQKDTNNNVNNINTDNNVNKLITSDSEFEEICDMYQSGLGIMTPAIKNDLKNDFEKYGAKILGNAVFTAIKENVGNNPNDESKYKYINTTMKDWKKRGLTNKEDIFNYLERRELSKGNNHSKTQMQKRDYY